MTTTGQKRPPVPDSIRDYSLGPILMAIHRGPIGPKVGLADTILNLGGWTSGHGRPTWAGVALRLAIFWSKNAFFL